MLFADCLMVKYNVYNTGIIIYEMFSECYKRSFTYSGIVCYNFSDFPYLQSKLVVNNQLAMAKNYNRHPREMSSRGLTPKQEVTPD